jgi:DNA polymerase III delta prime subunit
MSNSSIASELEVLAGLDSAKRVVARLIQTRSGVHAVLFYGARGAGKRSLARILTRAWVCTSPEDVGREPQCRPCASFSRGQNPDVRVIEPTGLSNIISVRQITESKDQKADEPEPLRRFFGTGPLVSRHKVAMIFDAHRMNESASNALLKTLEEPMPHAKLILTTDSIGGVRSTILSRCLAVACELPAEKVGSEVTDDEWHLADGSPGRLAVIRRHPDLFRRLAEFAERLSVRNPGEALQAADEWRSLVSDFEKALEIRARAAGVETLQLLAGYLDRQAGRSPRRVQLVIEAHRRVQGNANAGLIADALFARILQER